VPRQLFFTYFSGADASPGRKNDRLPTVGDDALIAPPPRCHGQAPPGVRRKGLVADVPFGEHRKVAIGPCPSPNSPPGCWIKMFESLPAAKKQIPEWVSAFWGITNRFNRVPQDGMHLTFRWCAFLLPLGCKRGATQKPCGVHLSTGGVQITPPGCRGGIYQLRGATWPSLMRFIPFFQVFDSLLCQPMSAAVFR